MELLQLKYFQRVAHLEHMTAAAKEFFIAQPSLSKTIQRLEEELGAPLFDRKGKYIKLNKYGKIFLKKVDIILSALEDGKREIENMKNEQSMHVNLVCLAASPMLPGLLSSFSEKYPEVNFHLMQHMTKSSNDDADLYISTLPLNREGMSSIPLMTEKILLAIPKKHPLAHRKSIKLTEVANENFIQLRPGSDLRKITDSFCKLAGFTPRVVFESDDPATVRGLIKIGQGISFIPEISWGDTTGSAVTLLEIEAPICQRTIELSWPENRYHTHLVCLFREFTIDYFTRLVEA